jgi:hypothetical protein
MSKKHSDATNGVIRKLRAFGLAYPGRTRKALARPQ